MPHLNPPQDTQAVSRRVTFGIRLRPDRLEWIRGQAKTSGLTTGEWIRQALGYAVDAGFKPKRDEE